MLTTKNGGQDVITEMDEKYSSLVPMSFDRDGIIAERACQFVLILNGVGREQHSVQLADQLGNNNKPLDIHFEKMNVTVQVYFEIVDSVQYQNVDRRIGDPEKSKFQTTD